MTPAPEDRIDRTAQPPVRAGRELHTSNWGSRDTLPSYPHPARPSRHGASSPAPPGIGLIRRPGRGTARLTRLTAQVTARPASRATPAFALRWSAHRRHHQAVADTIT